MGKKARAHATLTIGSLGQVQALAHPLRFRMFERLVAGPHTGKQLAAALGTQPTSLYHHLRVLERAGLVRQVSTRKKRGTTEKYFQAVSNRIAIDPGLFAGRVSAGRAVHSQVLRITSDELLEADRLAAESGTQPPIIFKRLRIRSSPAKIDSLVRQLERWLSAVESALESEGAAEYAMTVAFYPTRTSDSSEP